MYGRRKNHDKGSVKRGNYFIKGGVYMETIIQFISNVGFPIFAFCLMYNQSNTVIKENTKAIQELSKKLND